MRFRQLRLDAFGSFTDTVLDFGPPGDCDLHVVLGPNEAGKSTTLRAIDALLFGFPNQTRDAHIHPYDRLRVRAVLDSAPGESIELSRVKRRVGSLRDAEDQPLADAVLRDALGGVEPDSYRRLFLIDQEELRAGGRGLLAGGGELGISLFGATLGAGNLAAVVAQLQEAHEQLFSPSITARKPPLNAALRAYREHSEQARKLSVRPREYDQARSETERLAQERAATERMVGEHESTVRRLERLMSVAGPLARRRVIVQELASLRDIPDLPTDAPQQRQLANEKLRSAEQMLASSIESSDRHQQEIDRLIVPRDLLARAKAIRALADQAGAHESALRDRPKRARDLEALTVAEQAARAACEHPMPELSFSPDDNSRQQIERLAEEHAVLLEQQRVSGSEFASAQQALEQARTACSDEPDAPQPPDGLIAWLQAAEAQLPGATAAEEQLARTQRSLKLLDQQAREMQPPVSLADLASESPPSAATIGRYLDDFQALERSRHQLALQREQLSARAAELRRQYGALGGEEAQQLRRLLLDARRERDQALHALAQAISAGDTGSAGEHVEKLRSLIAQADGHADTTLQRADLIARSTQVSGELAVISEQLQELERTGDAHDQQQRELTERWQAEWVGCRIEPLAQPAAMLAWQERHVQLAASRRELLSEQERQQATLTAAEHTRTELLAACAAAGSPAEEKLPLSALRAHAKTVIDRIQAAISAARVLQERLAAADSAHAQAAARVKDREQALAAWKERWARAVRPLGLPGQATTLQARAQLAALTEITTKRNAAAELTRRIAGIDDGYATFGAAVAELAGEVAVELAASEPIALARELRDRLELALAEDRQLSHLRERLESEQERSRELELIRQQALAQLQSLLDAAHCQATEDLPPIEEKSALRAERQRELQSLEQRIVEQGEQPVEELELALQGRTSDELVVEHTNATAALRSLRQTRDELISAHAQASERLRQLDRGAQAAGEAEQAERQAASAGALLNHYLAERGAVILLRRAIELHRERSAHPVLERAQELLAAFTGGSLRKLLVNDADGHPVIVARRASGVELDVEGMSTGTRDQLYLALRLAALEHHLLSRAPLPVLLDDVLVNTDEARVCSSMPELAQLAHGTQLILLTHHQHVADIATDCLGERARIHRLAA